MYKRQIPVLIIIFCFLGFLIAPHNPEAMDIANKYAPFSAESVSYTHLSDHTGIVEKVENGRVYTIEGNSGDSVRQNSYPVGHYEVLGYGCPAF